jgi:hypothetical protein
MKKVLVITYYWPPSGGPGVQRILKFVQYLPQFGWQPVVLTVKQGEYPELDPGLQAHVSADLEIHRTRTAEPYAFYRIFVTGGKFEKIPTFVLTEQNDRNILKRAAAKIRGNLFVPDAKIGWIPFAVRKAMDIISKDGIDLIFSTSPPQTVNLIAAKVSHKSGLRWVADMRDPWTDIFYYHQLKRYRWARKLDQHLEKSSLSAAGSIITVSSHLKEVLENKNPVNVEVIPNGFDEADFSDTVPEPSHKFCILHTGHLAGNQNPEVLWKVLSSLCSSNEQFRNFLQLEFYGSIHSRINASLVEFNLQEYIRFNPYVSHDRIVEVMRGASLLYFVIPECSYSRGILTSKLFDYIGARRPVLGIGPPDGDAAAILNEVGSGSVFAYHDTDGVERRIAELFGEWQKHGITVASPSDNYLKYSRRYETGQLADIFNRISEAHET